MRFAVDTGGTFTDLVVEDDAGQCRMFKASTTPDDPVRGVLDTLEIAAESMGLKLPVLLGKGTLFIHGTTHALNAIITARTAKTAFITSAGHPDILVLREGGREEAFNFTVPFPQPYIPKSLTFEVPGRIRPDGSELQALDEAAVLKIIQRMKELNVEAVAVCLLWSIANPAHEMRVGELLEEHFPGIPYTLSHRLNPSIREFRRASSAAVDASLKPLMQRYLDGLQRRLEEAGFDGRVLVVTSNAGVIDAADAAAAPIHIVNSGPSMAPVAGRMFADIEGSNVDAIITDTGGTTYDVSLVRQGVIPTTRETWIGERYRGVMLGFPWVDVKSVGSGGGSIAWLDSGGLLHVGPTSAGARPGPAAYGTGGERPTVTDAAVALGYLDPEYFLGGSIRLSREAAVSAIEREIAKPLGIDFAAAAEAILAVATENMVQAIADITVNQGVDPARCTLIGGGGAAGLNIVRIARRLNCSTLVVPDVGPALSAAGALMSDLKAEFHSACFATTNDFDFDAVNRVLAELVTKCKRFAKRSGTTRAPTIRVKAEARYDTQVWEIEVPVQRSEFRNDEDVQAFTESYHASHHSLFGFDDHQSGIEIIGWTAVVTCPLRERKAPVYLSQVVGRKETRHRQAFYSETGWTDVDVVRFGAVAANATIAGPAILENEFTTIVIEPGATAQRLKDGGIRIHLGSQQRPAISMVH